MRARVTWLDPEFGGRKSGPPSAGEYRPYALFLAPHQSSSQPLETEYGSVRFILATDDHSDVELDFRSPQDLSRYIYEGSPFIVMEGPQPGGLARMFDEAQSPS